MVDLPLHPPRFVEVAHQPIPQFVLVDAMVILLLGEGMQQMYAFELMWLEQQGDGLLQEEYAFVEIGHIQHLLHRILHILTDLSDPPVWPPPRVLQYAVGCLLEESVDGVAFGVAVPEVLSREVHLELQFHDVVDEEEQAEEAVDDASHVAQEVEQAVVTPLVDGGLVGCLEDDLRCGLVLRCCDISEHIIDREASDCSFGAEGEHTVIGGGIGGLDLVVIQIGGTGVDVEDPAVETVGEHLVAVAQIDDGVGDVELYGAAAVGEVPAGGGAGEVELYALVGLADEVGPCQVEVGVEGQAGQRFVCVLRDFVY